MIATLFKMANNIQRNLMALPSIYWPPQSPLWPSDSWGRHPPSATRSSHDDALSSAYVSWSDSPHHTAERMSFMQNIMASQINGNSIVCSPVCSSVHQSSGSLACCEGNPPVTSGFPSQRASDAKIISMSWHHHMYIFMGCSCQRIYLKITQIADEATMATELNSGKLCW